jgi:predicted HTH domain antitoxin
MTLRLPDTPVFEEAELRLELACALYIRGKLGKVRAAEFAAVSFFEFQQALADRGISSYNEELVREDFENIQRMAD